MNHLKKAVVVFIFILLSACSLVEESAQSSNILSSGNRGGDLSVGLVEGSLLTLPYEFMVQDGVSCEEMGAVCEQVGQNAYANANVDILVGLPPAVFVEESPVIRQVWPDPNVWVDPASGETFIDDELPEGEPKAIFMPNTAVAISDSGEHLTAAPHFLPFSISSRALIDNSDTVNQFLTSWLMAMNGLQENPSWYFEEGGLAFGETVQSFGWDDTAVFSTGSPIFNVQTISEQTIENYQIVQEKLPSAWQERVVPIIFDDGTVALTPAVLSDGVLLTAFPSQGLLFPVDAPFIPGGDTFIPGGDTFIPGGDTFIPGGDTFIPGGDTFIPGGDTFFPIGNMVSEFKVLVDAQAVEFIPGGDMFVTNSVNAAGQQMSLAIVSDGVNYLVTHDSSGQLGR
ncbi:MAG: hypothetical protein AAF490_14815 [Chloroflexota bacterium]